MKCELAKTSPVDVQAGKVPRAVKGKKQGSRLSAFGYHTFSFQLAFDAGRYRFPFAILKSNPVLVLESDICVQHHMMIFGDLIRSWFQVWTYGKG